MKQAEIYFTIQNVLAYIGLGTTAIIFILFVFSEIYICINNRKEKNKRTRSGKNR